jgi:probable HAF family extracellular repeat protein
MLFGMCLRVLVVALALLVTLSSAAGAGVARSGAPSFRLVDLGTLGGSTSGATAINKSGEVVGYATTLGDAATHAFRWRGGTMTDLGVLPGGGYSCANAINDRGQIVGTSDALVPSAGVAGSTIAPQAFLYQDGQMVDIDPNTPVVLFPGSWAYGINDAGEVVGDVLNAAMDSRAFLFSAGSFATLPIDGFEPQARAITRDGRVVGSSWTAGSPPFVYADGQQASIGTRPGQAEAISDRGLIVGWMLGDSGNPRAFQAMGNGVADLGTLGGETSRANAVNKRGDIVGEAETATGDRHGFLVTGGSMYDLNDLAVSHAGWTLESAAGINDGGRIVGIGRVGGAEHAFLLVPSG